MARVTARGSALTPVGLATRVLLLLALPGIAAAQAPAAVPRPAPIQDNSFLIEEAYNQEAGVVQHISTLQRSSGAWAYAFTQEWPVSGIRHQVSYTVPVLHDAGFGTGLGDVALNYRHQLVGSGAAAVAVSPRLSVLLPTGNETSRRGSGGLGFQVQLPASITLAPTLVTHLNLGFTVTPRGRGFTGLRATTTAVNLGGGLIWLARPWVNLMLEGVWTRGESIAGAGVETRDAAFVSPGIRWALNLPSGLQIVPGLAYLIGLGPSGGDGSLFLYLSFEHAFARR